MYAIVSSHLSGIFTELDTKSFYDSALWHIQACITEAGVTQNIHKPLESGKLFGQFTSHHVNLETKGYLETMIQKAEGCFLQHNNP